VPSGTAGSFCGGQAKGWISHSGHSEWITTRCGSHCIILKTRKIKPSVTMNDVFSWQIRMCGKHLTVWIQTYYQSCASMCGKHLTLWIQTYYQSCASMFNVLANLGTVRGLFLFNIARVIIKHWWLDMVHAIDMSFNFYLFANKFVFYCYWNTIYNEIARFYIGKISMEDKAVIIKQHCDLKSCGAHGVWWSNSHRRSP